MLPPSAIIFVTTDELATLFRVSNRTIRAWRQQGRLRAVRIGRELRFRRSDIDQLIATHLGEHPQEAA
jgi:excisionase family DNA binding protein